MVTSPHPWLDTTEIPLYVWRLPAAAEVADVEAFVAAWEPLVTGRLERYAVVVDLTHIVSSASPANRRIIADLEKRMAPFEKASCAGVGLVAPNPWLRGLATAITWVAPPPYDYEFFASFDEAKAWVAAKLAASATPSA
jgi:hypothetical protein